MTRSLGLICGLVLQAGCAGPEPASPPPAGQPTAPAVPASTDGCACYFATWSLRMACGTSCVGDARLTCSRSGARVDPTGCAFDAGRPNNDAGAAFDAGDVAEQPDAGLATTCVPASSSCTCTVRPSGSGYSVDVPCCVTFCVASQPETAWDCSSTGGVTRIPAVCGR